MDLPLHEVVIIGAGPAGARCARLLAESGRDVLVLDAGPPGRAKLCGGLLNRRSQSMIGNWGMLPDEVRVGPLTPALEFPALEYHDRDNRIRARYNPGYRNIDRRAFDGWLVELARGAGAAVVFNTRVRRVEAGGETVTVTAGGRTIGARWVIDASGGQAFSRREFHGPYLRRLHSVQGLITLDPAPDAMWGIYQTSYTPFFGWIIPKGGGRFLLGTALTRDGIHRLKAQPWKSSLSPGWKLLRPLLDYLLERGHRWLTVDEKPGGAPLSWPAGDGELWWGDGRLLVIGEAAGLASPFSGEGISYALASAEAAAYAVLRGDGARLMPTLMSRFRHRLGRAALKAAVGMRPWLRPWGLMLLPFHYRTPLTYQRWEDAGEDAD